jgi:hypothetical protein
MSLLHADPTNTKTHRHVVELISAHSAQYSRAAYKAALRIIDSYPHSARLFTFALECGRIHRSSINERGIFTSGDERAIQNEILARATGARARGTSGA